MVFGRGGGWGDDQSLNWVAKAGGDGNPNHVACLSKTIHIFPLFISTAVISPVQVYVKDIASSLRAYRSSANPQTAISPVSLRNSKDDRDMSPAASAMHSNVIPSVMGRQRACLSYSCLLSPGYPVPGHRLESIPVLFCRLRLPRRFPYGTIVPLFTILCSMHFFAVGQDASSEVKPSRSYRSQPRPLRGYSDAFVSCRAKLWGRPFNL